MTQEQDLSHSEVMDIDTYFKRLVQPETPPGIWRWEDIEKVMVEMEKDPKRYPTYRRAVCLVNNSWDGAPGASPALFAGFQRFGPGEHLPPHKHNSVALYYWVKGKGRAIVNGVELHFKAGDVLTCPAWNEHEFFNTGDEDLIMFSVHDLPILAQMRALFWEEPVGQGNIQQIVKSKSASWTAAESEEDVANLRQIVIKTQN
ncbi:MAG: cupin domain-containing protein [Pseudomonadota bacterium]